MKQAILVAAENPRNPFGTILVDAKSGEIVAKGINQAKLNPILHGEMDAINKYALNGLGNWKDLVLYTTAEPCCMCQSAILWAGIQRVFYGTSISKLAELGWRQFTIGAHEVGAFASFATCSVTGGILVAETDLLFERAMDERAKRL